MAHHDQFNARQGRDFVGPARCGRDSHGADPAPTVAMHQPQAEYVSSARAAPEPEGLRYVSPGRSPGNGGQQDSQAPEGRHSGLQARRDHQRRQARWIRLTGSCVSAEARVTLSRPSAAPGSLATRPQGFAALRPGLTYLSPSGSEASPPSVTRSALNTHQAEARRATPIGGTFRSDRAKHGPPHPGGPREIASVSLSFFGRYFSMYRNA